MKQSKIDSFIILVDERNKDNHDYPVLGINKDKPVGGINLAHT